MWDAGHKPLTLKKVLYFVVPTIYHSDFSTAYRKITLPEFSEKTLSLNAILAEMMLPPKHVLERQLHIQLFFQETPLKKRQISQLITETENNFR